MIQVTQVSKRFRIYEDKSRSIKETAINLLRGKRRSYRDIWALRDISVEINKGESIGFIGENGSGKSTFLKLLCNIYTPDEGSVRIDGKISALLELGVGFHSDLTGEENIYLNGATLGFDRKIMKKKFDEVVSFSEIGDFIYSPIRTYSSGMVMRLAFSIAMCVDPDILLIDEVLAVGDEAFQKKCITRLEEFKSANKTIILVSHSLELIKRFCKRAVLLHNGKIVMDGTPEETIEQYHILLSLKKEKYRLEGKGIGDGNREGVDRMRGSTPVEEEEIEGRLDLTRLKIIEVENSLFFAGALFFSVFGTPPPIHPLNYVALMADPENLSTFHIIGFIHVEPLEEIGLVGGLCIDSQWQGKGLAKILLSSIDGKDRGFKALFVYTGDTRLSIKSGYEVLDHPHLMVKWLKPLSPDEKKRFIDAAMAIGPF